MPSIDEIIQSALSSKELNSVDSGSGAEENTKQASESQASESKDVSEVEKVATILEKMAEDDTVLNSNEAGKEETKEASQEETKEDPDEEKTAEETYMEKMAVGATIVDTLRSLDEKGISEKAFKKYFQEKSNGE